MIELDQAMQDCIAKRMPKVDCEMVVLSKQQLRDIILLAYTDGALQSIVMMQQTVKDG